MRIKDIKVITIEVNIEMTKRMDLEYIDGKMEQYFKVNFKTTKRKDKVL